VSNQESPGPTEYRADVERDGIRVSLEVHVGMDFPDRDELAELVGNQAGSVLRMVEGHRARSVKVPPF